MPLNHPAKPGDQWVARAPASETRLVRRLEATPDGGLAIVYQCGAAVSKVSDVAWLAWVEDRQAVAA